MQAAFSDQEKSVSHLHFLCTRNISVMAANKFATMLDRNTHRMTVILVHAILEWILLILLLLNSLFSYLIAKFADYFGLKPPCPWCSRVDHIFQPTKDKNSYRDLVCETHAREISKLGYCMNHRKLSEAQDMCEDCSSSWPNDNDNSIDITRKIALFSWIKEMGMISSDNGEKNSKCSCCDVSLSSNLYSPFLLFKPSWGVLDYTQKGNLITAATSSDSGAAENSDLCKSDSQTDHCDNEHDIERNRDGEKEEHQILSDVDECSQRGEEAESVSNFRCKDKDGKEDEIEEELLEEGDSNVSMEVTDVHLPSTNDTMIQACCREDSDNLLVPIELIDSMTIDDQKISRCREEDHENHGDEGGLLEYRLDIEIQVESAEESDKINKSPKLESMEMDENEDSLNMHDSEFKEDFFGLICEQDAITQATQTQFKDEDVKSKAAAMKSWNVPPASGEDSFKMWETASDIFIGIEMPDHESTDQALAHELSPPLPCIQDDPSMNDNDPGNLTSSATLMENNDLGSKQVEEDRSISIATVEEGTNHDLSFCSVLNEVEDEKSPETPSFVEGLHHLHKKLLLLEKKELVPEESLDGSVRSEFEVGEGVPTVERLKSALKTEHKALRVLYTELEEERSASAIAANQTMAMITRLQEEKAAMQMEALQYQRMMEEQSEYDQEALQLLNELMVKREKEKQELEKELEIYRKKVLDYEAKEKRTRRNDRSGVSRTLSASSSNAEDSEPSIDLNHDGRDEDGFYNHHQESTNHNTPTDEVLNLEDMGSDCAKHLCTLDESLADFEEERFSILEQLKALEEKLFTLADDDEQFIEDVKAIEDYSKENGDEFNQSYDINGIVNGYCEDSNGKVYQERRTMGAKAKRLLPIFDAVGMETENGILHEEEEEGSESVVLQNYSVSKSTLENKKLAIEEEVDHVYERLHAFEADREFLKHCINSLKKGDKGLDLLQEILQHLRDLRTVELRVRNMSDGAPA